MTSTTAPTPKSPPSTMRRVITIAVIVIAALVAGFFLFANLYADFLWYDQLGFDSVLLTQWGARGLMFVIGFVAMAVPLWLSIHLAHRLRPVYAQLSSQLDRYQEVIEPLRRLATWGIPIFFGFFAGFSAATNWETAALWLNGGAIGEVDPEFGLDLGFYMFTLPFFQGVLAFASAVVLIGLVLTLVVSYLYGSVRIGQGELRISKAARFQIAITAAVYILLQAVSLWLDRYGKLIEPGDRITGPGYVGTNAEIPGLTILSIAAVLVAALFLVTAFIGRWRLPLVGTGLLLVTAIVVNLAYPAIINTLQVQPNQFAYESEYYQRNVDGTRTAYDIDDIEVESYSASNAYRGRSAPRRRRDDRIAAPDGPRGDQPDCAPAAAALPVLQLRADAQRRPLRDRRRDAGHRRGGARAEPVEPGEPDLAEHRHGLHPRLRPGCRARATSARPTDGRCSSRAASRPAASSARWTTSRGSTSARTRPSTRSSGSLRVTSPLELDYAQR